jgi:hypothetical protein
MNIKQHRVKDRAWLEKQIAYKHDWYKAWINTPEGKESSRVAHKQQWIMIRNYVRQAKDKPCMDCHKKYGYWCMDFDHRNPTKKTMTVAQAARTRSIPVLLREIKKCDLVCSNCHRNRTYKRLCEE